jgi:hypothetical protein
MPSTKPPAPRTKPHAPPSKPAEPGPKPSAGSPPRKDSLEIFAERTTSSLKGLTEGRDEQHAAREAERDEVARALKLVLKDAPELKPHLDRVSKALKEAREREAEAEARVAHLLRAGLSELAEFTERHLR